MSSTIKDAFFSYNWSIKDKVKQLSDNLEKQNITVWRDEINLETNDKPLTSQLADAIKNSKIFICFVTINYCKSFNCNLEFEYANSLAKPMIVLMIERLLPVDISDIIITGRGYRTGIGFIIKYL